MGILNKLKNALFEEEEIEIDSDSEKIVIKDEEPFEEKKEIKTEDLPLENDRELFKAENTFNFPDFDEEEFVTNYEPEKKIEPKIEKRKEHERGKTESIYLESKGKISREKNARKREKEVAKEVQTHKFVPSPIISPVYGILDKNYKKEDIMVTEKREMPKKIIDVDMVRKKAFGTLEDDIEKTINETVETFYNEESKSIDDLLTESTDDTIEIDYEDGTKEIMDREDFTNNIEEELDKVEEDLEVVEEQVSREENNEEYLENNTLENDLFDLIDSMYENREEEQ